MYEDDSNGELEEIITEGGKKVMRRKKRKKKRTNRLNETDILLAKAYGGKPKPSGRKPGDMS